MNPRLSSRFVLTDSEARLVRLLATFPESLEKAWDVPRDLSLPGLADRLGVVRSALNPPITSLENRGLIKTRQTHVIGGGHRKRTVVHLTKKGREIAEELEPEGRVDSIGELFGNVPPLAFLHGRSRLVQEILEELETGSCVQLIGLPGIGKTSLLRVLAEEMANQGKDVRWATMHSHHDVGKLAAEMLGRDDAPKDVEAAGAALVEECENTIFVIDELQETHERHLPDIASLLTSLAENKDIRLVIGCRAPSPIEIGIVTKVDEISEEDAQKLLPEDLEEEIAQQVVSALGGHPLALKLWQPGHTLPEADDRIQEFIRTDVVEKLAKEELATMDELAASPLPILVDQLSNDDGVNLLDDTALLRWIIESIELQHLVRNVRRTMWSDEEAKDIHSTAAEHWADRIEPAAIVHETHHRVQAASSESATEVTESLESSIGQLLSIDSAAAAAIIQDAINILPNAQRLNLLSARVAIERGEGEHAEKALSKCDAELQEEIDWRLLNARVKRLSGKFDEANQEERAVLEIADPSRATKILLNRLVLSIEDRLPQQLGDELRTNAESALDEIDLSTLESDNKKAALVTIAAIRHSLALATNDADTAAKIRTDLATTASHDDPIIEEMAARAALIIGDDPHRVRSLISRTANPLRRCALGLLLVKHAHEKNYPDIAELLADVEHPSDLGTTTARRLSALHWYWRGVVDNSQRVKCWQEAMHRFGMAECANAYTQLQHKLHDVMRLL
jgi:DNA-binding MarR family transcriptional regulator